MPSRRWVNIRRRGAGELVLPRVRWCASFWCRLRGLMFRRGLREGEALLMVEPRESRAGTAIHMFFVPFAIAAVWIDNRGCVVDKTLARPWRPWYGPRAPARYILEASPAVLDRVKIGDELDFEDTD